MSWIAFSLPCIEIAGNLIWSVSRLLGYTLPMNRLDQIVAQLEQQSRPPVHLWSPAHSGDIDINIDAGGHWFHEGEPISRPALVRLFASILWFENDQYYLVTPVEKLRIRVADVPFIVQQVDRVDAHWVVVTNTLDKVIVSNEAPVELRLFSTGNGDQWVPYVCVRYQLWARLNRASYYQWVEAALGARSDNTPLTDSPLVLTSGDYVFEVGRV